MNAYGHKQKGAANIVAGMARLFTSPHVKERRTTWHEPRIRFIRPDEQVPGKRARFSSSAARITGSKNDWATRLLGYWDPVITPFLKTSAPLG
jgi:hypothetical protein